MQYRSALKLYESLYGYRSMEWNCKYYF
jgi:hypothetical protein